MKSGLGAFPGQDPNLGEGTGTGVGVQELRGDQAGGNILSRAPDVPRERCVWA